MIFRRTALFFLLVSFQAAAFSQEAAFYSPNILSGFKPAIRYEESRGVFHYVVPCKQVAVKGSPATEIAICWPVNARRLRMVDGKFDFTDFIPGILTISATQVRFIPDAAKDMQYWNIIPAAGVKLAEDPAKITRYLTSKEVGYKFGFKNYCDGCDSKASALDPAKEAQLVAEFQDVAEALAHFDQTYARISGIARKVRFTVAPRNQPSLSDPHAAMGLYGALNRGLAAACPVAAQACLKDYERYQTCESASSPAGCGAPPSCTATCALTPESLKSLQATECWGVPGASATLIPSWNQVLKEEDASRTAKGESSKAPPAFAGIAGMGAPAFGLSPQPGWGTLAGMGTSVPTIIAGGDLKEPDKSCSVGQTYERLKADHLRNIR